MAAYCDLWGVCTAHCVRVYCVNTVYPHTVSVLWLHIVTCETCVLCTVWGYTVLTQYTLTQCQCYGCILWPVRRVYSALCEGTLYTVYTVHCVRVYCVNTVTLTQCQCYGCILWPVRRVYCALCEGILYTVYTVHCVRVYSVNTVTLTQCQCYGCILWPVRRVYCALCEGIPSHSAQCV